MKHILTFGSTHKVLKAESVLEGAGIGFRLEPAPKSITTYCDIVITLVADDVGRAVGVLDDAGCMPASVLRLDKDQYVKV